VDISLQIAAIAHLYLRVGWDAWILFQAVAEKQSATETTERPSFLHAVCFSMKGRVSRVSTL
jgi:hypothetical protein